RLDEDRRRLSPESLQGPQAHAARWNDRRRRLQHAPDLPAARRAGVERTHEAVCGRCAKPPRRRAREGTPALTGFSQQPASAQCRFDEVAALVRNEVTFYRPSTSNALKAQARRTAVEHLAIDLGSKKSQICVRAADGTVVEERKLETLALGPYLASRPPSRVIVETCAESFRVADIALEAGHEVRVVPATLVRTLGVGARKTKTDKRDAQILSEVSCRID